MNQTTQQSDFMGFNYPWSRYKIDTNKLVIENVIDLFYDMGADYACELSNGHRDEAMIDYDYYDLPCKDRSQIEATIEQELNRMGVLDDTDYIQACIDEFSRGFENQLTPDSYSEHGIKHLL